MHLRKCQENPQKYSKRTSKFLAGLLMYVKNNSIFGLTTKHKSNANNSRCNHLIIYSSTATLPKRFYTFSWNCYAFCCFALEQVVQLEMSFTNESGKAK